MEAKMRANFINSVASGQKIPCPSCNTLNDSDADFCFSCGQKIKRENAFDNTDDNSQYQSVSKNTCPSCNKQNDLDANFCAFCGYSFSQNIDAPMSDDSKTKKQAFKFVEPIIEDTEEPVSAFANGLPSWSIVPPNIMVRRKKK